MYQRQGNTVWLYCLLKSKYDKVKPKNTVKLRTIRNIQAYTHLTKMENGINTNITIQLIIIIITT